MAFATPSSSPSCKWATGLPRLPHCSVCILYLKVYRQGAEGEGDDRGWDGSMASLTRWTWVWVNSGSWWWTGRPGVLRFMGSQRVGHNWATELSWTDWITLQYCIGFAIHQHESVLLRLCSSNFTKIKRAYAAAKSLQSCPTLCDPIDCSPPGFPVPGILQARTLEWVAISFSNA